MDSGNLMRSILPKPYLKYGYSFVGPGTKVILLKTKKPRIKSPKLEEKNLPLPASSKDAGIRGSKKKKPKHGFNSKAGANVRGVNKKADNVITSPEDLKFLKDFVSTCNANPAFLNTPELVFFKNHLKSIGAKLPSDDSNEKFGEAIKETESVYVESISNLPLSHDPLDKPAKGTECVYNESMNSIPLSREPLDKPIPASKNLSDDTDTALHNNETNDSTAQEYESFQMKTSNNIDHYESADEDAIDFVEYDVPKLYPIEGQDNMESLDNIRHHCPMCEKSFTRRRNLVIHMRKHTGKNLLKPRPCPECGKLFYRNTGLHKHMIYFHSAKPFQCKRCDKSYKTRGQLKYHMKLHTGIDPCKLCGKVVLNMRYHMKAHIGKKSFHCTVCDMAFLVKSALNSHMLSHSDERPIQCSYCGKTFKTNHTLKAHTLIHTGETPYQCTECGKAFKHSASLKIHMRLHTGEKPYQCSHCGMSFISNSAMDAHTKRHHLAVRPYPCNLCEKSFIHKGHLEIHIRIHNGERPFQCVHCGKTFLRKSHLNKHMESHTYNSHPLERQEN